MTNDKPSKTGFTSVLALFSVGVALALPSIAHAQVSIVPVSVCKHRPEPGNAPASVINYSNRGRLENGSTTQPVTVACPIVRQNAAAPLNWVRLYIRDRYSVGGKVGQLTCTLRVANATGGKFKDLETISTDPSGGRHNLGWTLHNGDQAAVEGSYVLDCTLPPLTDKDDEVGPESGKSSIGSIIVDEPNP